MNTVVQGLKVGGSRVRNVLDLEMLRFAHMLNAALFLTGSQYYAGRGEGHDYRMVVEDPVAAVRRLGEFFPNAVGLANAAEAWGCNTIGLKFERHGALVSVQFHSVKFMRSLCALKPVTASVMRATATSGRNQVFGFGESFETEQVHRWVGGGLVGPGAWLVEIDQDPWLHGEFCTQIYHNMVLACRVMRNRHGFGRMRRGLIRRVAREARRRDVDVVIGFMSLLARNREQWTQLTSWSFALEVSRVAGGLGR